MLTHHRRPVSLSLVSTDLPIWSEIETAATLYQKDKQVFHLLLTEPAIPETEAIAPSVASQPQEGNFRLLWLELSPYRAIMTVQENGKLSYRHLWEKGIYGTSRYWLHSESLQINEPLRLRNYTRSLTLEGYPMPERLRVEYELWSATLPLGRYIFNLDIHH
jgi:hypothetical protein